MNNNYRVANVTGALKNQGRTVALVALTVFAAGCSADVTRFDQPPFGLTEDGAKGSIPRPQAPLSGTGDQSYIDDTQRGNTGNASRTAVYQPSSSSRREAIRSATLPALNNKPPAIQQARFDPLSRPPESTAQQRPANPSSAPAQRVAEIEVQRGDTLYGLSRRHGVTLNALMRANGLTKPNLKPGQKLQLPAGATANAAPPRQKAPATVATPANAPSSWGASYTVASGDSLYKIARKFGIKTTDLQRYNGINNPRRVRPGTILKVPGSDTATRTASARSNTPQPSRLSNPQTTQRSNGATAKNARVAVLNGKPASGGVSTRVVQSVSVTPPKVTPPDTTKLRWPVRGKVISKFGRRPDGTQNDGINLEVPAGTNVTAAESGVVAYAGSELRGYGKLVLVRHKNGWVTAYAHNKDVLVKRGDKVSRGQTIAKAGNTGQVDRPQVHFELRRDAKPVDPIPYLETL